MLYLKDCVLVLSVTEATEEIWKHQQRPQGEEWLEWEAVWTSDAGGGSH